MDIASSIKKYKNSVTRKYISLSNDEIDVVIKGEYWFSRKYDGQLWFYASNIKKIIMLDFIKDVILIFLIKNDLIFNDAFVLSKIKYTLSLI